MGPNHSQRIRRLRARMASSGSRAFVVTHLPNVLYLTGFTGSAGVLVVQRAGCTLFTDGRYTTQAREEVQGARVEITASGPLKAAGERLRALGRVRAAFEQSHVTVTQKALLSAAAGRKVQWNGAAGLVEELRAVKDEHELTLMRRAARIGQRVLAEVLSLVRPGVRETELAAELEYRMRRAGASGPAFETIVASGPRSALPHARPTARRLRRNELVVFDLGAIISNYCCDLTRTVFLGRAPAKVRLWHKAVWEAHQAAIGAVGPGVACEAVDQAARQVLAGHKLDRYFTHSTGHGFGIEVHEDPRLARGQKRLLKTGNTITIEPGIYVPGIGGIRIEDDVLVTACGAKAITRMNGELLEL